MNLESRKLEFIQEFLKLQSEETITLLEKILKKDKKTKINNTFKPMTQKELDNRIDQSEDDFKKLNFKSSDELLAK